MFTIRYHLAPEDLLAFNRFVIRRNRKTVLLNLLGNGGGPAIVFYLLINNTTHDPRASFICAIVLGAICGLLWWAYVRSQIRASVKKQFTDPKMLHEREVVFSNNGVRERTPDNDSFHTWQGIDGVGITPAHVFIQLNPLLAYIVPRSVVPEGAIALMTASLPSGKLWATGAQPLMRPPVVKR